MSLSSSLQINQSFGYHNAQTFRIGMQEGDHVPSNVLNAIGYIPILGIFVAAIRFMLVAQGQLKDNPKGFYAAQIFRGVLEFSGAGILLLIPDLIVSLHRHIGTAPTRQEI